MSFQEFGRAASFDALFFEPPQDWGLKLNSFAFLDWWFFFGGLFVTGSFQKDFVGILGVEACKGACGLLEDEGSLCFHIFSGNVFKYYTTSITIDWYIGQPTFSNINSHLFEFIGLWKSTKIVSPRRAKMSKHWNLSTTYFLLFLPKWLFSPQLQKSWDAVKTHRK